MMMMDWDAGEDGGNGPLPKNSRLFRHEYPKAIKTSVAHGEKTLMVNAAIMDEKNNPMNAPWLIDLDLPRAE